MLELVLYGLLAILVAGGLFLLATWLLPSGEQIAPPLRDEAPWSLPPDDRALSATEVDSMRLPVALRGYRFAETDMLLDRLATELRNRDAEIAALRARVHPSPSVPAAAGSEPPPAGSEPPPAGADD